MKIVSRKWNPAQELNEDEYICSVEELDSLPTSGIAAGSTAIVDDGKIYFLFPSGEWKPVGGEQ